MHSPALLVIVLCAVPVQRTAAPTPPDPAEVDIDHRREACRAFLSPLVGREVTITSEVRLSKLGWAMRYHGFTIDLRVNNPSPSATRRWIGYSGSAYTIRTRLHYHPGQYLGASMAALPDSYYLSLPDVNIVPATPTPKIP